jgi:hypothetical protein
MGQTHRFRDAVVCPLHIQHQTFPGLVGTSHLGQTQTSTAESGSLLDQVIGPKTGTATNSRSNSAFPDRIRSSAHVRLLRQPNDSLYAHFPIV